MINFRMQDYYRPITYYFFPAFSILESLLYLHRKPPNRMIQIQKITSTPQAAALISNVYRKIEKLSFY